jgi:hypothetical protein
MYTLILTFELLMPHGEEQHEALYMNNEENFSSNLVNIELYERLLKKVFS